MQLKRPTRLNRNQQAEKTAQKYSQFFTNSRLLAQKQNTLIENDRTDGKH